MLIVALSALNVLHAQTLLTKKEGEDLLQNAADAADLWASDTPPFHLLASIHYELGGRPSDGTYEILWASPDQYRVNFSMRTANEVQVVSRDKLYVLRNTPSPTFPLWTTRMTLRSVKNYFLGRKVRKVRSAQIGGLQRTCFDSGDDRFERENCFDPATNRPVSVTFADLPPRGPLSHITKELKHLRELELGNFAPLGKKYYPLSIISNELDEKLAVTITTLEELKAIPEDAFAPLAGAQALDWCSKPTAKGTLQFPSGILGELDPPGSMFPYYVLVGRDGRAQKSMPMRSAGPHIDDQMAARLRMSKFPIQSCGGNAIEYETVVPAPVEIRLPNN